jgi:hypothetical protein
MLRDSSVGSYFRGSFMHVLRGSHSLSHILFGSARGSHSLDNFVGCLWALLCPLIHVGCLLVELLVDLLGIRSEDLGRGVLEGNFCTVERL